MKQIDQIDDFLLDRVFQPIVDSLHDRGGNHTQVALTSLMGYGVFVLVILAIRIADGSIDVYSTMLSAVSLVAVVTIGRNIQRTAASSRGANPRRVGFANARVFLLFWTVTGVIINALPTTLSGLVSFLTGLQHILFTSAIYLACCHDRPPERRAFVPARAATGEV